MSADPMRFRVADNQTQRTLGGNIMEVHPDGPYVLFGDYARLQYKSQCQTEGIDAFDKKLREAEAEVKRLRDGVETMTYHAPGVETTAWVRAVEYDRLKADVRKLTKERDANLVDAGSLFQENARLKAECERLTKAGDALENWIAWECESPAGTAEGFRDAWNAAKGVQP